MNTFQYKRPHLCHKHTLLITMTKFLRSGNTNGKAHFTSLSAEASKKEEAAAIAQSAIQDQTQILAEASTNALAADISMDDVASGEGADTERPVLKNGTESANLNNDDQDAASSANLLVAPNGVMITAPSAANSGSNDTETSADISKVLFQDNAIDDGTKLEAMQVPMVMENKKKAARAKGMDVEEKKKARLIEETKIPYPATYYNFVARQLWEKVDDKNIDGSDVQVATSLIDAQKDDDIDMGFYDESKTYMHVGDEIEFYPFGINATKLVRESIIDFYPTAIRFGACTITLGELEQSTSLVHYQRNEQKAWVGTPMSKNPNMWMVKRNPNLSNKLLRDLANGEQRAEYVRVANEWNSADSDKRLAMQMAQYRVIPNLTKDWDTTEDAPPIPPSYSQNAQGHSTLHRTKSTEDPAYRPITRLPDSEDRLTRPLRPSPAAAMSCTLQDEGSKKYQCPLCIAQGLGDGYVLPVAVNLATLQSLSTRNKKTLVDHCISKQHGFFFFLCESWSMSIKRSQETLRNYMQKQLIAANTLFPISMKAAYFKDLFAEELAGAFGFAIGQAKIDRSIEGYENAAELRDEAASTLLKIMKAFLAFDHLRWFREVHVHPSGSQPRAFYLVNITNLFFRRGLYWTKPHPAILYIKFEDLTFPMKSTYKKKRGFDEPDSVASDSTSMTHVTTKATV